jgi:predicted anti-sigma-YlaC factor YlaD
MDCQKIEDLISMYIEDELSRELHDEVALHLDECEECRKLKEKIEDLMGFFPELEEEVPFYLKNRLYYIPESQETEAMLESRYYLLRWIAAVIGTFVLFLNLFYFTNIYPPANRVLHSAAGQIQTITVQAEAFIQKVAETRGMVLISWLIKDKSEEQDSDRDPGFDQYKKNSNEVGGNNVKGGKNDRKKTSSN